MSSSETLHSGNALAWQPVCRQTDLVANSGVVVRLGDEQIALFYLPETEQQVFAVGNRDPKSAANVIGRGLLGQLAGELVIASPLYKQHFRLSDGGCLEYPEQRLKVWPARLREATVEIASRGDEKPA
ncbi:nitrite reductase small subunit NirD [Stutzerimonas kirkiae]|uniref:Nitrite reductase (NAD(P)H) small subunit n=1 Tax=Stutzerimonas kirkiae TaxID=2211392 RepID=A0A4Q9RCD7_9GAMM|nr:nitrite reductase small subunit NirD [Stutzerimonas kirkiae]TBU97953.1 nitrite reductase (NAD(P)H) small subunit [Stutzerimonas kirkiae]TBV04531.1 nitrite reductase (NAD(P)H) small subunit [Stutzerimonas kirkiae]TBV11567.1 nitrite reductase (NAD(P)H) small subunit [Stutzerimonas kirkiae]TBV16131.1 nitrite reductase (NAD(P)H) small subunit [Stutzerimonas kirkiae]